MNEELEPLGTPNISKTMSAFYQIGDAPVLIRDWNDNYGKRQIELKPLHQAREEQYEIIEKELKALEIILTKDINVGAFKKLAFGRIHLTDREKLDYWNDIHNNKITMEEYDLLKEVLCND